MRFDVEVLRELPGLLAGRLPAACDVGELTDAGLTWSLAAIGQARRVLDASAALIASEVARRSARELGTGGLAQRRGHKDGAGLVEELAGLGRGEAARLIRVGGLLETAEAVAPAGPLDDPDPAPEDGEGSGEGGGVPVTPPPRDLDVLRLLPGPWDAPVAVAVRNGWLSAAHGDALRTGLGTARTADEWRAAALELIADCWTGQWNPEDLARAAKRVRAALDTAAASAEAQARYEARSMRRFVRASGMVHYDLNLDPESDARFYGPIKRLLSPRFGGPRFTTADDVQATADLEQDPRSNEQLQADTLLDLLAQATHAPGNLLFPAGEPQVTVAVTTAELAKARAAHDRLRRHHTGDHTTCPTPGASAGTVTGPGTPTAPGTTPDSTAATGSTTATAPYGAATAQAGDRRNSTPISCPGPDAGIAWVDGRDEPITALDALRMICAGGFTPALFDETGQAIDLGKDRRLFTRTQRRALAKRDGGCLHPGCDRPPEDCEAHHINPWARHPSHRKSEVRDGVLLCRRHHKLLHDHGARIQRDRLDQYWLQWPGKPPALLHTKAGLQTQLRHTG